MPCLLTRPAVCCGIPKLDLARAFLIVPIAAKWQMAQMLQKCIDVLNHKALPLPAPLAPRRCNNSGGSLLFLNRLPMPTQTAPLPVPLATAPPPGTAAAQPRASTTATPVLGYARPLPLQNWQQEQQQQQQALTAEAPVLPLQPLPSTLQQQQQQDHTWGLSVRQQSANVDLNHQKKLQAAATSLLPPVSIQVLHQPQQPQPLDIFHWIALADSLQCAPLLSACFQKLRYEVHSDRRVRGKSETGRANLSFGQMAFEPLDLPPSPPPSPPPSLLKRSSGAQDLVRTAMHSAELQVASMMMYVHLQYPGHN